MSATEPARFTGHTGAGLYGGPAPTHKTACPQSNNPYGHSVECSCGWARVRAAQTVPYYPPEPAQLHELWADD